jgi:hypothetical protein
MHGPFDTNLLEAFRITTLPNTIERYMVEATGQSIAHIHCVQYRRNSGSRKPYHTDISATKTQGNHQQVLQLLWSLRPSYHHLWVYG